MRLLQYLFLLCLPACETGGGTSAFRVAALAITTGCTGPVNAVVGRPVRAFPQAQPAQTKEATSAGRKRKSVERPRTIRPQKCEVISDCRVVRAMEVTRGRSKSAFFSRDESTIYHFGVKQDFDAASFRLFKTENCPLWQNNYVSDKNDVYIASPRSCGGDSCGENYTGFYWAALGVKQPSSFVMLGGGYGRDATRIYYQWGARGEVAGADPRTFEVMWCHAPSDENEEIVARDAVRYFIEGKPVTKERVEERWGREPQSGALR